MAAPQRDSEAGPDPVHGRGDHQGTTVKLDKATARRLAVKADCDPRTITKALCGEPIKGMSGQRARAIFAEIGLIAPTAPCNADMHRRPHPGAAMTGDAEDVRLDTAQVLAHLHVTDMHLCRMVATGFPAPHYFGERRRWWLGEILEWEASHVTKVKPAAETRGVANLIGKPERPA